MRVGIDLDGVCYPFEDALRWYLFTVKKRTWASMPAPTQWHFYEDWGLSGAQFHDYCNDAANTFGLFARRNPYPGTVEALERIYEDGHTIHVITARDYGAPGVAEQQTVEWLTHCGIPYHTVTFSQDKTVVKTDWYIDDHTRNVDSFRHSDTRAVLMDRTWNQGTPHERVSSLMEYADLILGEA